MYKLFSLLVILSYSLTALHGQEMDKVILKDQKSFKGKVVEQKPGEYIKLAIQNTNDTMQFAMENIDRIIKVGQTNITSPTKQNRLANKNFNNRKFYATVSGLTGGGEVAFGGLGIGLHYRTNSKLSVGFSTAYLGETGSGISAPYQWQKVPIYLDIRYDLEDSFGERGALFTKVNLGYCFSLDNEYTDPISSELQNVSNGFALKTGLGYRVNILRNTGLLFDISYLLILDEVADSNEGKVKSNNWNNIIFSASLFF